MSLLKKYFSHVSEEQRSSAAIAYLASIDHIRNSSPQIAQKIIDELRDQRSHLKLIASENFSSLAVQLAMGNLLTDKYAEGSPFHRFYAGCDNIDAVEQEAVDLVKALFQAEHAYVQPHSGADANLVAFWSILMHRVQNPEVAALGKKSVDELSVEEYERVRQLTLSQKIMGLSLSSGGHLTHGYRHNVSSKIMRSAPYDVDKETGLIDYSVLKELALRERPDILVAGYSAYPRCINFATMREIAHSVGATLLVDMAHFAGLVAGKVMKGDFNPIPFADIVTSTTHKTLRGPRGGLVLCRKEFKEVVDKGCPLVLGGPLPHVIAAKAVAFREASGPHFEAYAHQVVANSRALAEQLMKRGARLTTSGTDNHLLVIDTAASFGLTGRQAESALREARFTVNRNAIPFDINGPWYTSGVRLGTPAITTLGMKEAEMGEIAALIFELLTATKPAPAEAGKAPSRAQMLIDPQVLQKSQTRVEELLSRFPLYPELPIL
jgi:glycine hydroxymethyltransferase